MMNPWWIHASVRCWTVAQWLRFLPGVVTTGGYSWERRHIHTEHGNHQAHEMVPDKESQHSDKKRQDHVRIKISRTGLEEWRWEITAVWTRHEVGIPLWGKVCDFFNWGGFKILMKGSSDHKGWKSRGKSFVKHLSMLWAELCPSKAPMLKP